MPKRKEIKAFAKAAIKNKKPRTGLVTLVYVIICLVLGYLSNRLSAPSAKYSELIEEMINTGLTNTDAMSELLEKANAMIASGANVVYNGPLASLLTVAISVITMVLAVGFMFYCIRVSRGVQAGYGDLFDGFASFGKVFLINILKGLIVFAWTIPSYIAFIIGIALVIVGAIPPEADGMLIAGAVLLLAAFVLLFLPVIAEYRYAMSLYYVFDDPDVGISEALRRSKAAMKGNKWKLFVLEFSFIGWYILCIVPFVALFVVPYVGVARAEFYNCLCGVGHKDRPALESDIEPEAM